MKTVIVDKALSAPLLLIVALSACSTSPETATHTCPPGEEWPAIESHYDEQVVGSNRVIESNGIPNHCVDTSYHFDIQAQSYSFTIPANPAIPGSSAPVTPLDVCTTPTPQRFGVALNGVVFDPEAIAIWVKEATMPYGKVADCIENIGADSCTPTSVRWQADAAAAIDIALMCNPKAALDMDDHVAHTQDHGLYHYHKLTAETVAAISGRSVASLDSQMTLVGWAFDGFPVYWKYGRLTKDGELYSMTSGYTKTGGPRATAWNTSMPTVDKFPLGFFVNDWVYTPSLVPEPGAQLLDECNGKECYSPELGRTTYCYFITDEFPYIPRCLRGTPTER